ncbi:MAG: 2-oxoacid:acceptor oxidoreductase family protein, partial [Candidatus Thorarchaeota archaeon]
MTQTKEVSILIGGEAGAGISAAGVSLGKAFMRGGFHVFGTIDYPSLIRGGHNFYTVRASKDPVYNQWDRHDLIIALDENSIHRHWKQLKPSGGILYDEDEISSEKLDLPNKVKNRFPVPLETIVKEIEGRDVVRNTVALGATLGILGYNLEILETILQDFFAEKGDKVVTMNVDAARAGYNYAQEHHAKKLTVQIKPEKEIRKERILLTGNESVALGAVAAGCQFYAAYPMTPASPLLHFLIAHAERFNMVTIQAESEIAAINMAIGASYAGVRAMTGTSG